MKKPTPIFFSVLLLIITSMVAELAASSSSVPIARRYDSIFSFGDSFADTGNDIVVFAAHSLDNPTARPPYGMTFFGHPTGRNSNGRLIIDFIGEQSTLLATSLVFVCDCDAQLDRSLARRVLMACMQRRSWGSRSCRRRWRTTAAAAASGEAQTSLWRAPSLVTPVSTGTPPSSARSLSTPAPACSSGGSNRSSRRCANLPKVVTN
jgi:hypothetical protein